LTPGRIRDAKARWENDVAQSLARGILPQAHYDLAVWTFVNLEKLPVLFRAYDVRYDPGELKHLMSLGIVDRLGIPQPLIEPNKTKRELLTIFDRLPFQYGPRLMEMYSLALHDLILKARPVDFRQITKPTQMLALLSPGTICYGLKGFRFSRGTFRRDQTEIRRGHAKIGGTIVRFQVNTRYMFGTSALTDSYLGHRQAGVLLLVKSINSRGSKFDILCTPIAMGTGFLNRRGPWNPGSKDTAEKAEPALS
jgi:hypothetical protein